jgi:hypothetical protein
MIAVVMLTAKWLPTMTGDRLLTQRSKTNVNE